MNEYLTKPLDKKLLLSMVHKCATTTPILHPNLNRIMELTPEAEVGNPLEGMNKGNPIIWETRQFNSQTCHQEHTELRRV